MEKNYIGVAAISVTIIVIIQISIGVLIYSTLPSWAERGQFGDLFGAVNALFSGLAFAGVIYAILLQREDLALQRVQLERSAKAQEESEKALKAQAESSSKSTKLATLNFLLAHYQEKLKPLRGASYNKDSYHWNVQVDLLSRERLILDQIDVLYQDILIKEKNSEST